MTLDHLSITGGAWGVVALSGADSDRITIRECEIFGNGTGGIFTDAGNDAPFISDNRIHDDGGAGVVIWSASGAVVSDNAVYNMTFGTGIEGAVDRYVAMTRATQRLVVLTSP